ncbi:MAG TPA: SRPBCC domain-containing protein [Candidatus Angelobacter sp.]|nr:SRPBCC domain-containing protein [Candidatus Angelobacter sp.]
MAKSAGDSQTADGKSVARALVITRTFDAPRELVWKAWTDPERMKLWWGPECFTSPACKIDLRVGGRVHACMRSPQGQEYWNIGVYLEIVEPLRLVYTDHFADEKGNIVPASHYGLPGDWPPETFVTVTFEDIDGKTRMTLRHAGIPAGVMSEMTGAGWNGSLDKLAASLKA